MKKYFATLDIGTSHIKGMIWDRAGHPIFCYKENSPILQLNDLFAEQNIKEFYQKIIITLQKLNSFISFKKSVCLAISTQRNTFIALNEAKDEQSALISWLDRRGSYVNGDRFDWFQQYFSSFNQISYVRSLMSWLCEKLTGKAYETASTTPYEWFATPERFAFIKGPELVLPGTELTAKSQDLLLRDIIPDDFPIIIGAGDKDCALLAGQGHLPARAVLCGGTAISMGKLLKLKQDLPTRDHIYFSPTDFRGYAPVETGLPFGGGVLTWLKLIYQIDADFFPSHLPEIISNVFCIPPVFSHVNKMDFYPKIIGIDNTTNKSTLAASAVEGIILELIRCKSLLESFGEVFNEIMMGGNHLLLMQHPDWLANALQCKVTQVRNSELTSLGLAVFALSMIEQNPDYFSIAENFFCEEVKTIYPNASATYHWQERFKRYNDLL